MKFNSKSLYSQLIENNENCEVNAKNNWASLSRKLLQNKGEDFRKFLKNVNKNLYENIKYVGRRFIEDGHQAFKSDISCINALATSKSRLKVLLDDAYKTNSQSFINQSKESNKVLKFIQILDNIKIGNLDLIKKKNNATDKSQGNF